VCSAVEVGSERRGEEAADEPEVLEELDPVRLAFLGATTPPVATPTAFVAYVKWATTQSPELNFDFKRVFGENDLGCALQPQ
jgi:hypothetical protein